MKLPVFYGKSLCAYVYAAWMLCRLQVLTVGTLYAWGMEGTHSAEGMSVCLMLMCWKNIKGARETRKHWLFPYSLLLSLAICHS